MCLRQIFVLAPSGFWVVTRRLRYTRSPVIERLPESAAIYSPCVYFCRTQAGALNLASPEVKFTIDTETNNPLDVGMYEHRATNSMVEEMMLLANITVATHIQQSFPSCAMLRRHETPTPTMFEPLKQVGGRANTIQVQYIFIWLVSYAWFHTPDTLHTKNTQWSR